MNHSEIVSFLWGVADLIRDTFKRGKYQDVILPLTVLRRLDCVLAPTKEKVLARQADLRGKKLENLDPQLRRVSGFAFYNTSRYDFDKLVADAPHLAANLRTAPAQLPGQPGTHRTPGGGARLPGPRAVEEEGRRGGEGAGRRPRPAGGNPGVRPRPSRHTFQGQG
jgi:hypothetical protein